MRVLYVVSLFPCWSETFIVREMHAMREFGARLCIFSLKPASEKIVQDRAAELLPLTMHPRSALASIGAFIGLAARKPSAVLGFVWQLLRGLWRQPRVLFNSFGAICRIAGQWRAIEAFDPQLIHAPWATYPATVGWFASRVLGIPFSFTSRAHDIFVEDHMMAAKLARADLAVTITQNNVRHLSRWMPTPGEIAVQVIHSALDLDEINYQRDGRETSALLSVGRLDPIKGFDVLMHALAELQRRGVTFRSTIIGEGEEHVNLVALRDRLGLADLVEFVGAKPHADVRAAMATSTLMVMPCVVTPEGNADGIPNVLTEAMGSGLPVVSTRVSGIPELIDDGVSGRIVEQRDPMALANAVQMMLADAALREACARAGRAKIEREFDVRIEAGRLYSHFKNLVDG